MIFRLKTRDGILSSWVDSRCNSLMLRLFTVCPFQSLGKFFQTNDYLSPSKKRNLHVLWLIALWLSRFTPPLPWVFWVIFFRAKDLTMF